MPTNNSWNSEDPAQVAKGGTGFSSTTAYAVICGGTTSTAQLQPVSGVGTSGQVLKSNGAAALPTWQDDGGSGGIIQQVRSRITTPVTTGTVIPIDSSIPQSSEGAAFASLSITPTDSSSILMVDMNNIYVTWSNAPPPMAVSFFLGAATDAFWAYIFEANNQNSIYNSSFTGYVTAGTTSPVTISIRVGLRTQPGGEAATFGNGSFGGVGGSALVITEFAS